MRATCPKLSEDVFEDVLKLRLRDPGSGRIVAGMATVTAIDNFAQVPVARGGLTRDEVMTAGEVAELLHLPVSTVYYLARRGEIPACRLGRAWRFVRPRIEELLAS
jgi:excisionase family DNA binding protein